MSIHSAITNQKSLDGWNNVLRGVGGNRDISATTYHQASSYRSMLRDELESLYTQNWIASKVVDIVCDDATKDDREIECEDASKKEMFVNTLEDFDIDNKINTMMKWSKVFGSAVLVIVSNDAKMSEPLIVKNIKQGDLVNIALLDRFDIFSNALDRNPLSKRYLKPVSYNITRNGESIHHTRVIQLDGVTTTNYARELMQGFGLSIYERMHKTIMNANVSPNLLINLLSQSNQDVYKIKGLNDSLTNGQDELVMKRLEVIQQGKSIFNGISLDSEDDYTNIAKTFGGLSEINKDFYQIVAGAADIPYTRFMGAALSGLNPTGAGELKNYYDKIIAEQKKLVPIYNKLDQIIQMHLFGELLEYKWEFPSLFQMSDDEESVIANRDAQTREIYLRSGVINEMEARAGLADNHLFPTITGETIEAEKSIFNEIENVEPNPNEY